jgi:hypothetical protein
MSIAPGLIAILSSDPTVTAAIAGRIYPVILPETPTYPALTYRILSNVPTYDLTGAVIGERTRIEFTAWSTVYGDCQNVHDAIRSVLDGFNGATTGGGFVVVRDGGAVDDFDVDRRAYTSSVDYRMTHPLL